MKTNNFKTGETCYIAGEMRLCRYISRNIVKVVETGHVKSFKFGECHPISAANEWMIPFFNGGTAKQKLSAFYFHYAKKFFSARTEKKFMIVVSAIFAIVVLRAIIGILLNI